VIQKTQVVVTTERCSKYAEGSDKCPHEKKHCRDEKL